MNLYLDDLRPTPADFDRVYDYEGFTEYILLKGLPDFISFDHDLGEGKSGYDCAKFLIDYCLENSLPLPRYAVHSQNPVGRKNIEMLFENFLKNSQQGRYYLPKDISNLQKGENHAPEINFRGLDVDFGGLDIDFRGSDVDFGGSDVDFGGLDIDFRGSDIDFGSSDVDFGGLDVNFRSSDIDFRVL